jgi:hypothetical protein
MKEAKKVKISSIIEYDATVAVSPVVGTTKSSTRTTLRSLYPL